MTLPITSTNTVVPASTSAQHSLQAMIELVYVQAANQVLNEHLVSLENSLAISNNVMATLAQVQTLHNAVNINAKGNFSGGSFNFASAGRSASKYESAYKKAASAYFGTPITVKTSGANASTYASLIKSLSGEIPELSAVTPTLSNGQPDPNALLAYVKIVYNTMKADQGNQTVWYIDGYNSTAGAAGASAGTIQQNITNAITAGQSLNTTQTESVRNFLYLFEEYYKSASAILTQMTQLIQKMADGISH